MNTTDWETDVRAVRLAHTRGSGGSSERVADVQSKGVDHDRVVVSARGNSLGSPVCSRAEPVAEVHDGG